MCYGLGCFLSCFVILITDFVLTYGVGALEKKTKKSTVCLFKVASFRDQIKSSTFAWMWFFGVFSVHVIQIFTQSSLIFSHDNLLSL